MTFDSNTVTANMIDPAGQIAGLDLNNGQHLVIRDYSLQAIGCARKVAHPPDTG